MKVLKKLTALLAAMIIMLSLSSFCFALPGEETDPEQISDQTGDENSIVTEPEQTSQETDPSQEDDPSQEVQESSQVSDQSQEAESSQESDQSQETESSDEENPSSDPSYTEDPSVEPDPSYDDPVYDPEASNTTEPDPSYEYIDPGTVSEIPQTSVIKSKISDPFTVLGTMDVILPVDRNNFNPHTKADENSLSRNSTVSSSSQSSELELSLLNTPPLPDDNGIKYKITDKNDAEALFLGMIFWSVIGIVVTAVLIIIVNSKGNDSEFVFSRKRYHKGKKNNSSSHSEKFKSL